MTALYNENEPYAVDWLRNLEAAGYIAAGAVDARSIIDLAAEDVASAVQFHAFAGVGAWSYALRLAGWPDYAPVWTGSCPCQPFSQAGRRKGVNDARHLWPEWFRLIRECRPPIVFGEQVASPDGRAWLDAVLADLEGVGFAVGAADLCAAGVGAPHIRQRLYWVAVADDGGIRKRVHLQPRRPLEEVVDVDRGGAARGVAVAPGSRRKRRRRTSGAALPTEVAAEPRRHGEAVRLGDSGGRRNGRAVPRAQGKVEVRGLGDRRGADESQLAGVLGGPWADAGWIACTDGRFRSAQPGSFPLAHGAPARVGRLRAYGNAIVPEVAATFIRAAVGG